MLEAHYRAVADEGDLPIVVYNVPGRTGTNVDADTFLRLAEHPRVVAVKEASGNLDQIARICRDRPRDVAVLAGDDAWTLPILAMGGDGVVSVASNEVPGELVALCAAARAGDWDGARRIHERWLPLVPGQLPRRPEPGPGEGRAGADGPARRRRRPGAAAAARPDARAAMAATLRGLGLHRSGRRSDGDAGRSPARPWHDRRDEPGRATTSARRHRPGRRPRRPRGRAGVRAAEPDPTAPDGWRVRPDVKTAILACFADRTTRVVGRRVR